VDGLSHKQELRSVLEARGRFGHREHLELAWRYLHMTDLSGAERLMASAIRDVANSHGAPNRYHHTMTLSWLRLVAAHVASCDATSFETFLARNEGLLDRQLLAGHFSAATLSDPASQAGWVAPDLRPLPVVAG
jgi:hypothetical protein